MDREGEVRGSLLLKIQDNRKPVLATEAETGYAAVMVKKMSGASHVTRMRAREARP
jgi:hypothetical protein